MRRALVVLGIALVAGAAVLWSRKPNAAAIARLIELHGAAVRDFAARERVWKQAQVDASFAIGDAVRTAKGASARLRLTRGGTLKLGSDTLVRFLKGVGPNPAQRIAVDTGEAELEATSEALVLFDARFGQVRVERGATARISRQADRTRFEVLVGTAVLDRDGLATRIGPGERVEVDVGGAIIERAPLAPEVRRDRSETSASERGSLNASDEDRAPDAGTAAGLLAAELPTAAHADVSLDAGESAVVHDARAPTAVGLRIHKLCAGDALLELLQRGSYKRAPLASRARGFSVVVLAPGAYPYRVRCLEGAQPSGTAVATGKLWITKDSGAARISRKAPRNVIDADGRKYTLLYQSLLPELTFRWPNAPSTPGVTLHIRGPQAPALNLVADAATRSFKSGAFSEGSYWFWFDTDQGLRSPETRLKIAFDNAAPAAEIQSPAEGAAVAGGSVDVLGVALEGANVSVGGVNLPLDAQQRFRGSAALAESNTLAIRIALPARGIHYYVRRLGK